MPCAASRSRRPARPMSDKRGPALFLLLALLFALLLLAAGLPSSRLALVAPPSPDQTQTPVGRALPIPPATTVATPIRDPVQTTLIWIVLPLCLAYVIWQRETRHLLVRDALTVSLITLVTVFGLARLRQLLGWSLPGRSAGAGSGQAESLVIADALILSISLALAAGLTTLILYLGRRWLAQRRLAYMAAAPRIALSQLAAGQELRDVILRCYAEMSRAVSQGRGLQRQTGMTPREFEARLVEAGLPLPSVQRLTRLFERARYGAGEVSMREELEARDCLTAILAACEVRP